MMVRVRVPWWFDGGRYWGIHEDGEGTEWYFSYVTVVPRLLTIEMRRRGC